MGIDEFDAEVLQQICSVLAETDSGLSGSEIGALLDRLGIADPHPGMTKRHRLFEALNARQRRDASGNNVAAFIKAAMSPVRYHSATSEFDGRLSELNTVLAFCGMKLAHDGELETTAKAATLDEAHHRADAMAHKLRLRVVHPDVLRFCRAELVENNYFHAVLEATKSVAQKIRDRTGLTSDGAKLVDSAFGGALPLLALNTLRTDTERSEQSGFINLLKGMFGLFRNVTGHAPKITWPIEEADALDLLTMASYLHRRIDEAVKTKPPS